jgi:hypothetical protein
MTVAHEHDAATLECEQRVLAADKLSDMAECCGGALVFSQALSERPFSMWAGSLRLVDLALFQPF